MLQYRVYSDFVNIQVIVVRGKTDDLCIRVLQDYDTFHEFGNIVDLRLDEQIKPSPLLQPLIPVYKCPK